MKISKEKEQTIIDREIITISAEGEFCEVCKEPQVTHSMYPSGKCPIIKI